MDHVIDQALDILKDAGPEYGNGFSNHGPMAAEALLALGQDDIIIPWVLKYRKRLPSYPVSRENIDSENNKMLPLTDLISWILILHGHLRIASSRSNIAYPSASSVTSIEAT